MFNFVKKMTKIVKIYRMILKLNNIKKYLVFLKISKFSIQILK